MWTKSMFWWFLDLKTFFLTPSLFIYFNSSPQKCTQCCGKSNFGRDCNTLLKKSLDRFPLPCVKQNKCVAVLLSIFNYGVLRWRNPTSQILWRALLQVNSETKIFASRLISCLPQRAVLQYSLSPVSLLWLTFTYLNREKSVHNIPKKIWSERLR